MQGFALADEFEQVLLLLLEVLLAVGAALRRFGSGGLSAAASAPESAPASTATAASSTACGGRACPAAAAARMSVICSIMPLSSDMTYRLPPRVKEMRLPSGRKCGLDSFSEVLVIWRVSPVELS